MPRILADLHIHSRYSRATSKSLDPESLHEWGALKGLHLIGTGDATHPLWLDELSLKLRMGEDGLYGLAEAEDEGLRGPRFAPTGEISCVYKHDGQVRKVHLVFVAPDLEAARRLSRSLARLGNVAGDGRPILGLAARDVVEIALTADPRMEIIPAHVWTPWFSLFGSKSGYDRLEDCFGDLSGHIRALETGLSSDPAMNRLVSALDRYALVSSSDAHSAEKLGRECTILKGDLSFDTLASALHGGPELVGTVEFFPEEGKYHLDGHAKCGPALTPSQTREAKGICPVCGKPVTVGVLSRVYELADREVPPVADMLPDWHCVPLLELLGQVLDMGTASKEVQSAYQKAVAELGGELEILLDVPIELIKERAGPVLARAVEKARDGVVELKGGYDGVYGTVQVLSRSERLELAGGGLLFGHNPVRRGRPPRLAEAPKAEPLPKAPVVKRREAGGSVLGELTDEQTAAVTFRGGDLVVLAGPGSGKTMTLTRRAAYLTARGDGAALVTTYTRKAAETLLARISRLDPEGRIRVTTLHALALAELNRQKQNFRLASPEAQEDCLARAARSPDVSTRRLAATVSRMKSRLEPIDSPEYEAYRESIKKYQRNLEREGLIDFDDLINLAIQLDYRGLFAHVLADEFQDFTLAQVRLLDRLAPKGGLTVIGDPDQSVYGFRGALDNPVETLASLRGPATKLSLTRNFRSNPAICRAAEKVRPASTGADIVAARKIPLEPIGRATVDAPWDESAFVVSRIRAHLGVTDLGPRGGSAHESEAIPDLTLGDIAILFRIRRQGEEFARALAEAGLPWQMAGEAELTATDGLDFTAEKISLLTMHAAKGLEFRLVFVTGVEAGLTPLHLDEERLIPSDHAEERRLFYVALTRAKDKLYLTRCAKRSLWGRMSTGGNSPFWRLVPGALTFDHDPAPASRRLRRGPKGPPPGPRLF